MKKTALVTYAASAYLIGIASLIFMMGFMVNFWEAYPIDHVDAAFSWAALLTNIGMLVAYFGVHSIMARPRFKQWWTQWIPQSIERSTYILVSGLTLIALLHAWQPVGPQLWTIQHEAGRAVLVTFYLLAWLLMGVATFNIDHFSFFGLRQVYADITHKARQTEHFSIKFLYRFCRHPISLCWFLVVWLTPDISLGHLIFALVASGYIILITPVEEQDLENEIGEPYKQYQKTVRRFIPFPK